MKKFLGVAMASIMLMATSSYGQNYPNRSNQQNSQQHGRPTQMDQRRQPNDPPNRNYGGYRQNDDSRQFSRGRRAPDQYRQPKYYVNDWQAQRLNRPPSGYRWVRNDNNQFILIAIATGIIAQVIAGNNNQSYQTYQTWHNGENLPRQYRGRNYYVNDWANHGLSRPSYGRRWVHVNHQYLLININGGQIRAAVSSN